MRSWAGLLQNFPSDELAAAFQVVALTAEGWPALGNITKVIFDAEFTADYAWLLQALRRHTPEWKDVTANYAPPKRIPGMGPDDLYPAVETSPAIPAPAIPCRLRRAAEVFGGGTTRQGLDALYRHPSAKGYHWEPAEEIRVRRDIDRDFRAAWQTARNEELSGGVNV